VVPGAGQLATARHHRHHQNEAERRHCVTGALRADCPPAARRYDAIFYGLRRPRVLPSANISLIIYDGASGMAPARLLSIRQQSSVVNNTQK